MDSGPLTGLLDSDDHWQAWSEQTLTVLDEPLATTETATLKCVTGCGIYGPLCRN